MVIPKVGGSHVGFRNMTTVCEHLGLLGIKGFYVLIDGGFMLMEDHGAWLKMWVDGVKKGKLNLYVDCKEFPDWTDVDLDELEVDVNVPTAAPMSQLITEDPQSQDRKSTRLNSSHAQ